MPCRTHSSGVQTYRSGFSKTSGRRTRFIHLITDVDKDNSGAWDGRDVMYCGNLDRGVQSFTVSLKESIIVLRFTENNILTK